MYIFSKFGGWEFSLRNRQREKVKGERERREREERGRGESTSTQLSKTQCVAQTQRADIATQYVNAGIYK